MIRKAVPADLDAVLSIYRSARSFMAASGNPTQWGDDYPHTELVIADIDCARLFVDEVQGRVCGVFMFAQEDDPTYARIKDGAWISSESYAVIHRVASDGSVPGVFSRCLDFCRGQYPHLRMDTHKDNKRMQALLTKAGFVRCGIIYAPDDTPLIAYELI